MNFKSEGKTINSCEIGYRSLGFGEDPRLETTPYELTINLHELTENFFKKADSFIHQCKIDDTEQGYADIEHLEKSNYANFQYIIKNKSNLAATIIKDYLYFDLLDSLFPIPTNLKIVVNSIESISIEEEQIIITGEAFPSGKLQPHLQ